MNHVNVIICVAFSFIFIADKHLCHAEIPKLTVDLISSGFHRFELAHHTFMRWSPNRKCIFVLIFRDLRYVVVFPDYQAKHHTFLIKQPLPAAVYVSTDQLDDLRRFDKVRFNFKTANSNQSFKKMFHFFRSTISLTEISWTLKCQRRNRNRLIFICLVIRHFYKP